jgi:hypothetical protein
MAKRSFGSMLAAYGCVRKPDLDDFNWKALPPLACRVKLFPENRMAATACASELRDRVSGPKVGFVKAGHKVGLNEVADGEVFMNPVANISKVPYHDMLAKGFLAMSAAALVYVSVSSFVCSPLHSKNCMTRSEFEPFH